MVDFGLGVSRRWQLYCVMLTMLCFACAWPSQAMAGLWRWIQGRHCWPLSARRAVRVRYHVLLSSPITVRILSSACLRLQQSCGVRREREREASQQPQIAVQLFALRCVCGCCCITRLGLACQTGLNEEQIEA
ncbi:hypothetical protein BDP55DRAFT_106922 [Colletotrichum godetiae]|uniref:Uncharacterized protein n=1 Tax=Colletotrichum godetiae TaxID=1209918 RepID=A0AAJ0AMH3_9PEZI|nr:uncharacterized protein BDP55DRAFT_106922 [Colletotrichum godetiae]KAK1676608.1 hypothetical protein BDP55DRAFT_106922 [Colletotrichum godetiae]